MPSVPLPPSGTTFLPVALLDISLPSFLPFRHSCNAYLETTHFHIQCLSGFPSYHTQQNQGFVSWPTSQLYVTVSLLFLLLTGSSTHPYTHIPIHLLSLHLPIHHPSIHPSTYIDWLLSTQKVSISNFPCIRSLNYKLVFIFLALFVTSSVRSQLKEQHGLHIVRAHSRVVESLHSIYLYIKKPKIWNLGCRSLIGTMLTYHVWNLDLMTQRTTQKYFKYFLCVTIPCILLSFTEMHVLFLESINCLIILCGYYLIINRCYYLYILILR